jgi:C4-dicarboxylate-specific signal transduction histidine kinase
VTTRRLLATRPAALALGLVLTVFVIDLSLPLGVASAVPYTFAVLLALTARPRWIGPAVAGACGVLTVAKIGLVPEKGATEWWKVIANRCLALFAIGMTTLLGLRRRRADEERAKAEETTRQHTADLARMGRLTALGQMATDLAHELNQPLAAVCLQADIAAQLVAAAPDPPPALAAALQEVVEQSRRAADIVWAVRRLARKADPQDAAVDVNEAARTVVRLLDWLARRANAAVETALAADLPLARGDRVQVEQVLFNLIQNALEAVASTHGPRVVRVETAADGPRLVVRVTDSGGGLSDPDRVFERFYTTKPDGTGTGLSISRAIAEAHGGTLTAANPPVGGAAFTLTLPTG